MLLERIDFRPRLLKLCQEFELLSSIQNVDFEYSLEENSYDIEVEPFHLENAINNLLDNAKKYSENPKIYLQARVTRKNLEICILDNGKGISKEDQQKIFKKYFRVGNGDQHNVKGYGLGLSYVKRVIQGFKGKIELESEVGRGTKIALLLPLVKDGKRL